MERVGRSAAIVGGAGTMVDQGVPVMVSKKYWGIMALSALQYSDPLAALAADSPPNAAPSGPAPSSARPAERKFPILEYRVEGNTRLTRIDIERAVMPYLGVGKSIKDVEAARQNLEKTYHARGYQTVLVNIPQQEVSSGIVRLSVVEATVGRFEIKGSHYHSLEVIRATVQELQPGATPDFNEVQKELAAVNHSEDLHVTPVLRASTTPGQVDVDLDVQDALPLHGQLEANNRYSANTAHLRLVGEVSYDNLFQSNQSASIQYQIAPENPMNAEIGSISYVIPTKSGPVFALYAVHSDSNIGAVGALNVIGKGNIYGLRVIEPLASTSSSFYHNFTAGIDYKDFKQDVVLQGSGDLASPARYAPFTLDYNATWLDALDATRHARAAVTGGRSNTNLDLGVSFLVRFIGGTDAEQFAAKRFGADPNYFIFRPGLQRQQILPGNWSLVGKIDGQLASGPLITNEQYGAGGIDSVRGYTESERLGDDGVRGSLELRTPQLLTQRAPRVQQSYLFLFADGARLKTVDPLPDQQSEFHMASFGAGFRFKLAGLSCDLDGARAASEGFVTRAGSYSAQFRVNYAW
jgi:hemolysin activation/secretion protein